MIKALLIANRGEIACRIIRTARRLGIRTIAVYSDADAGARHVRQADEAVHIGPSPARDSYLVGEKIIAAARQTGAEAIHPGYGFLSENADFAEAVADAGLIWVGATPRSIRAMGLKDAAKTLMAAAGVPVTPGYHGEDQSPDRLRAEVEAIGYPVLIKAVAGGGGKGMRRVDTPADFADALAACQREAAAAFGDERVLIERFILSPRHIEVQVFGDTQGNLIHLFERDCSLQRRHQKVIEEAPAPRMDAATRSQLCDAAVRAARAVDYVGAGTIEFIADASAGLSADRIWFMEMNTRLQVEHPVTEAITGVDLVEWQLRIAAGEPLPLRQEELSIDGWAMEARLYAEDVPAGFLPSTGTLEQFVLPDDGPAHGGTARIETGVGQGSAISPYYDPMIAKLILHAPTRDEAALGLAGLVRDAAVWPVRTNAAFLHALLVHPDFRRGAVHTGFIAQHADDLVAQAVPPAWLLNRAARALAGPQAGPLAGFRLNAAPQTLVQLADRGAPFTADLAGPVDADHDDHCLIVRDGAAVFATLRGMTWRLAPARHDGGTDRPGGDGAILAPMPGRIIAVDVAQGETVARGQRLLTLEAMKMEHSLTAPFDGTVAELPAIAGAQVQVEALLARIVKPPAS
jgi:3-methylcrotonyl-CoA carboxylase alpha subunit